MSDEHVDLDAERQRYVRDTFERLAELTHYDILGLQPDADKAAIKRAYFELVRTIHPDRYFGKSLGTYRAKMEAIFARATEAYETLSKQAKRTDPVAPEIAEKRRAAMEALKQRFETSKSKASEHAARAERARAAGDLSTSAAEYEHALRSAPGDAKLQAAHAEVKRETAARLVEGHRKKAILAERWERWADAAGSWRVVVDAVPDDAEARSRLALALAKTRG
jgi:hypothetical protein